MVLTTEVAISDLPEKDKAAGGPPMDMGGMGAWVVWAAWWYGWYDVVDLLRSIDYTQLQSIHLFFRHSLDTDTITSSRV